MTEKTNSSQSKMPDVRRLYLSSDDKKLSGVCGGLAEYFRVDSSIIRLAWVVVTVLTGIVPGVLGYVIAAIVIPQKPQL